MKAEEHPLSQKPLIERITPGPWAWQMFGAAYCLTAQHGMREIILSANPQRGSMQPVVVMNQDGILQPIDPSHPNAEAISRVPELLKAEQELSEFREENEELTERANKYEEAYLTAEETITSQKKKIQELEETKKSLRKIQDKLLTKVRQLEDHVKYGFSEGTPQQHNKARIEKLEETISRQLTEILDKSAKIEDLKSEKEAILKGLKEIAEWRLPPTGEFYYEDGHVTETPVRYEAKYGSNGVRDYFKKVAAALLAEHGKKIIS